MIRRLLFVALFVPCAALASFTEGCGGKVGTMGPGTSSGSSDEADSSSGVVSSSSGIGSSSGVGSSGVSGSTSGSSSSSGTASGSTSGSSSSSGTGSGSTSGSSSGVIVDDGGPYSCASPAPYVPPSEIPVFTGVIQRVNSCSASEIAGFINSCDSVTATNTQCSTWFNTASPTCLSCLGAGDAGMPATNGGLWFDGQGNMIGANVPGCLAIVDGNHQCASAYDNVVQCIFAAGCETCTTQTAFDACQQQVSGSGGACSGYLPPYQSACSGDSVDGGPLNNGACSNDTQVLSIICGNGSADGG